MYQQIELLEQSKISLVTLKQAKQYLRVDAQYDDELIEEMLEVATVTAENYLGLNLKKSKWKMFFYDDLPSLIKLTHMPVMAIEQFKLYQHNGEVTLLNSGQYSLKNDNVYIKSHHFIQRAEIIYQVGYKKLPAPIKQGILEHLARLYDLRGSDQILPASAKSLYQAYKCVRF